METHEFQSEVNLGGTKIFHGRKLMDIPASNIVRSVSILVPMMNNKSTVNITLYSPVSTGSAFAVYQIKFNVQGDYLAVGIHAIQVDKEAQDFPVYCDYTIICIPEIYNKYVSSKKKVKAAEEFVSISSSKKLG